jgi:ABC-type phosphate transport system auxiliary subunit
MMKQMIYFTLAAGLLMSTGCKEEENGAVEKASTEAVVEKTPEVAAQAPAKPASFSATAETATQEVTQKATAAAQEVTQKATAAAQEVTKKTEAAVSALTVKAEDVMGDLNQSVSEIKQKVAGLDSAQVMAYASQYKDLILEKKDQIAALTDQLKTIPLTEMLGEKAKALKTQAAQYTTQLSGLKDRYAVYLDQLKEFGIDLSAYGL